MAFKIRLAAAVLCNVFCFSVTLMGVLHFFGRGGEGNMAVSGVTCFRYFTVDSNILAALGCLACLPFQLLQLAGKRSTALPGWVVLFKFAGTVAVTVTFLTVVTYLGVIAGYGAMLAGDNLFMHLITPLLCLVSCIFLEAQQPFVLWAGLVGCLPSLIYGSIYLTQVVFLRVWPDFYMFNNGGRWYLTVAITAPLIAGLSLGLTVLRNLLCNR